MPQWKLRDPSVYPMAWSDIILRAHDRGKSQILQVCATEAEARGFLNRFRCFRYCLRHHPYYHRAKAIETEHRIVTRTIPSYLGFTIPLEVKPKVNFTAIAKSLTLKKLDADIGPY